MPLTPLHHPLAYFIYKFSNQLSLPALIVGCMTPDIENPFITLLSDTTTPNRLVLHSILGAVTIGTVLAVIFTTKAYPYLVNKLFHVEKQKVANKCKFSFSLVISAMIGNLSHVLLDVMNHPYNPIFWPFQSAIETQSPIYFALGDPFGSLYMQIIMGALLVVLIFVKRKNVYEELLVG